MNGILQRATRFARQITPTHVFYISSCPLSFSSAGLGASWQHARSLSPPIVEELSPERKCPSSCRFLVETLIGKIRFTYSRGVVYYVLYVPRRPDRNTQLHQPFVCARCIKPLTPRCLRSNISLPRSPMLHYQLFARRKSGEKRGRSSSKCWCTELGVVRAERQHYTLTRNNPPPSLVPRFARKMITL